MENQLKKVCVELALPRCYFSLYRSGKSREHLNKVYLEFCEEFSKTEFHETIDSVDLSFLFRFVKRKEYSQGTDADLPKRFLGDHLVAKAEVDLDSYIENRTKAYLDAVSDREDDFLGIDWREECCRDFCSEVKRMVINIVMISNIVYPGCMEIGEGKISINDRCYVNVEALHTSLLDVNEEILEKGWPSLEKISLMGAWDWVINKVQYSKVIGDTPANRAMNAFSYQFNADNYEDLFYCLLGVEALYNTSSSDGIMEQIRVKTSILFGEPEEYKKRISQMYQIRSAFVHGSLNFPDKFYLYDAAPQYEEFYHKKYKEALITAQCILVASLRLLIKHQATGFRPIITINYI